ncbi:hypothetical protein RCC89_05065 [Cytophagaceae bacterium ABcell3]|nr:hypothetical protein RCC89_05065 [Cytophagaceae bacterium ABcell3]
MSLSFLYPVSLSTLNAHCSPTLTVACGYRNVLPDKGSIIDFSGDGNMLYYNQHGLYIHNLTPLIPQ